MLYMMYKSESFYVLLPIFKLVLIINVLTINDSFYYRIVFINANVRNYSMIKDK